MQRLTMFIAVAMLMAYAVSAAAATYQQFPTDDIWVYNNAVDPTGEPTLYAWGHSGYSIDPLGYPFSTDTVWEGEISYSYVKWNTSSGSPCPSRILQ